jgi:hypothetical protein
MLEVQAVHPMGRDRLVEAFEKSAELIQSLGMWSCNTLPTG